MTERPEERLVRLLEAIERVGDYEGSGIVYDASQVALPIARAMAEVVQAARETDRAFDATAFPALRTALQALDSLGED